MDLSRSQLREPVAITAIATGRPELDRRLQELGLRPGATVEVLRRTAGRGAIVAVGDDRLALARSVLAAITVTLITVSQPVAVATEV